MKKRAVVLKRHRGAPPKRRRTPNDNHDDHAEADIYDDFDPGTAFENLRHDLGTVETLAKAADEALEVLPFTRDPERRREIDRLYALVETTAKTATTALDAADRDLARLTVHVARRRERR
jgi:hypothetical protein